MPDSLFIRFQYEDDSATWCLKNDQGKVDGVRVGSLENAMADTTPGCKVCVCVPSANVVLTQAQVPTGNKKRLAQAIPYALEDQVIDDIDEIHFAIGDTPTRDRANVGVVSHAQMRHWMSNLRENGVTPRQVIPEILALPLEPDSWTMMVEDDQVLIRTGKQSGTAVEPSNVKPILHLLLGEAEPKPQKLLIYECDKIDLDLAEFNDTFQIERRDCSDGALVLFADGFSAQNSLNLLQGEYSPREQIGKFIRPWRATAAMLAIWVVVQFGVKWNEYRVLSNESEQLTSQIEQIYRDVFPETKRIVDARAQMENQLKALAGSDKSSNASFIQLLAEAAPTLMDTPGIELQTLRAKPGELEVGLTLKDLAALDQLKQRLTTATSLGVEIISGSSNKGKVQSRLKIWSQS